MKMMFLKKLPRCGHLEGCGWGRQRYPSPYGESVVHRCNLVSFTFTIQPLGSSPQVDTTSIVPILVQFSESFIGIVVLSSYQIQVSGFVVPRDLVVLTVDR